MVFRLIRLANLGPLKTTPLARGRIARIDTPDDNAYKREKEIHYFEYD